MLLILMLLVVPEFSDTSIEEKFQAIIDWTCLNKLQLNELVFHRSNPHKSLSDPLPQVERALKTIRHNSLKLLGIFNANVKFPLVRLIASST